MKKSNLVRIIRGDSDITYDPQGEFYNWFGFVIMIVMIPLAVFSPITAGRFLTSLASLPIDAISQITGIDAIDVKEVFSLPAGDLKTK